ncbi:MAG: lamin tail domain-containing protein [Candidatus Eisenbacteria bacterium]
MRLGRALLTGMLLALLPAVALGQVIPISDVNADDENGFPLLLDDVVTVKGIVTIGTGLLASSNDIYVQDATGGVNVIQTPGASPVVARGDSLRVTGKVAYFLSSGTLRRTYLKVDTSVAPTSKIELLSTGNTPPDPVVVTPRMLATPTGEDYEGIYAVVRRVTLTPVTPLDQWPDDLCSNDRATYIADADTSCRMWFDKDTDICGSPAPFDTFDVYGVVVPRLHSVTQWKGHGMLPPSRAHILSRGPGSGFATSLTERVFANQTVDVSFSVRGEADVLSELSLAIPAGWVFSGDPSDVALSGSGFAAASVEAAGTNPNLITITDAALTVDATGTIFLSDVTTPNAAGDFVFPVSTAPAGGALVEIAASPKITVGFLADPGTVLISEVYAHSDQARDAKDRAEFIELMNPGTTPADISGWVLTDLNSAGTCGGANLWEFPTDPPTVIPVGGHAVVTKDAWTQAGPNTYGFLKVFGDSVDVDDILIFEMVDDDFDDSDWQGDVTWGDVPNMVFASQADGNVTVSQEIRLLGGFDGTGASAYAKVPGAEAVYLYSDRTLTQLVDAMEYRDPVHFRTDHCPNGNGLGGSDDAYVPGPPPGHYSLVRDAGLDDTDDSSADFTLSSWPTPGSANVIDDGKPPVVSTITTGGSGYVVVKFNEPLDGDSAVDVANYAIQGDRVEDLSVNAAWLSRDRRTVALATATQVPDESYDILIDGVDDASGNTMVLAEKSFVGSPVTVTPINEVQATDEMGYSPLWGQTVNIVGFATVPPGIFSPTRTNMYVQDTERWGVNIYSPDLMPYPALEGDLMLCNGMVLEYRSVDSADPWAMPAGSTTEVANGSTPEVFARGFDVIEPLVLPTGDIGHEDREGTLVKTSGTVVSVEGFAIYIDDGSGACQVYQNFSDLDFSLYSLGDVLEVTGIVLQYDYTAPYFDGFELAPRYDHDIVIVSKAKSAGASVEVSAKVLDISSGEAIDIDFFSAGCDHVAVRIFDLKGRSVATVYDGRCLGDTRRSWDGRGDDGRTVPVGVYICHIQARSRDGGEISDSAVPIVVGTKLN